MAFGNNSNTNSNTDTAQSLLGGLSNLSRGNVAATQTKREPAKMWLNVGITVRNPNTGEDVFIALPNGIALDDMKPIQPKGNNREWVELCQTKNALLEQIQRAAAALPPGERLVVGQLQVELHRVGEAAQAHADAGSNGLVGAMLGVLSGGRTGTDG